MSSDNIPPPKEEQNNEEATKVIANLNKSLTRDSDTSTYGEDYYASPLTNLDFTETTGNFNVSEFLYNLTKQSDGSTPLVSASQNITSIFEGHVVISDVFELQNLSLEALQGMDAPQYYAEPGYLVSFRLAVNDPLISLKVQAKGYGENSYTIADYSMRKMAVMGLGMTLGEAEETVYTTEGETSRDLSGQPSTEYPWLARYKHLPTGTSTDYETYKSTDDDVWIVAAYTPRVYPKFNTLFFDIFNGNADGPRMIHNLQIKRYIIMDTKKMVDNPDYSKSVLNIDTNKLLENLLKEGVTDETSIPESTIPIGATTAPVPPLTAANYAVRRRSGVMQKTKPFFNNNPHNMISINKDDQNNPLFKDVVSDEVQAFNTLMAQKYKSMSKLKSI